MKTKIKKVWYCSFCPKHSLRSLKNHELHCTANPNRECKLCGRISIKEIIEKYRKYFEVSTVMKRQLDYVHEEVEVKFLKEFTLDDIKDEVRNDDDIPCPMCLLAISRNLGINRYYFDEKFKFDFKKELEEWWRYKDDADYDQERCY